MSSWVEEQELEVRTYGWEHYRFSMFPFQINSILDRLGVRDEVKARCKDEKVGGRLNLPPVDLFLSVFMVFS